MLNLVADEWLLMLFELAMSVQVVAGQLVEMHGWVAVIYPAG